MSETSQYHVKALPVGTVLREWRLDSVLGSGGFGIVYRGTGVYFGETVAIKEYFPSAISDRRDGVTVAPHDTGSEELYAHGLQKFVEEAKILWNLSKPERHPNIVCVRSLFEIHGTAYMVMDFESGVSLSQMLKEGRKFDERSLLSLIKPIARGLERAHRAGVFHRDIKPANIIVAEAGRPVLIDFGSARFDAGQVTSTKVTFYTPPYAALEQYVRTFPQGPWTDIYALGVTLYQCVTGEKPAEVLERLHGDGDQPLAVRGAPGFSRAFLEAVDAAMAIKPADRPQSIEDWLKLFDAPASGGLTPTPPPYDDATRIARRDVPASAIPARPTTTTLGATTPASSVATAATNPTSAPSQDTVAAKHSSRFLPIGLAAGALAAAAAAAAFIWPMVQAKPPASPPAAVVGASQPPDVTLATGIAQLADWAKANGRAESETTVLNQAAARLSDLTQKVASATSQKDQAALSQLAKDMGSTALEAAHQEASAIGADAAKLAKAIQDDITAADVQHASSGGPVDPTQTQLAADLSAAQSTLSASGKKALAADPREALTGALELQNCFATLTQLRPKATELYVSAKRAEFGSVTAEARRLGVRLAELAKRPKPGVFASRDKKDAFKALQDAAARAEAQNAELGKLTPEVGGANRKALTRLVSQAATIRLELKTSLASSEALVKKLAAP